MKMKHGMGLAACALLMMAADQASAVTYSGSWNNTSYGSSGDLTMDLALTATDASVTLTLGGFVFGQPGGAGPVVFGGPLNGDGSLNVNVVGDPIFGDVTGTISNTGVIDIEANNIPNPGIFSMTLDGTIGPAETTGTYVVNFNNPATRSSPPVERQDVAYGTFDATAAIPEPTSLALVGLGGLCLLRRRRA